MNSVMLNIVSLAINQPRIVLHVSIQEFNLPLVSVNLVPILLEMIAFNVCQIVQFVQLLINVLYVILVFTTNRIGMD